MIDHRVVSVLVVFVHVHSVLEMCSLTLVVLVVIISKVES